MKSILLILTCVFSLTVNAQVPDKAEDVSPLLIGESLPNATLLDSNGKEVSLKSILKEKPTVLVFYRGGWCPYCNQQLSALGEVENEIMELGFQIVAVSPDNYKSLNPTYQDKDLNYSLYADPDAQFIQEVGVGFKTPGMAKMYITKKTKMDATEVLPVPTVMVVDTSGKVLFEYINPDYKTRITSELLLSVLKALKLEM